VPPEFVRTTSAFIELAVIQASSAA